MAVAPVYQFLVLGTCGAGVTTALDIFADFDYLTVTGLDPMQLGEVFPGLVVKQGPVAASLRLTPEIDPHYVREKILALKEKMPDLRIFTLDAPAEVLVQRYGASEKPHPYEKNGLQQAVNDNKKQFEVIKNLKDYSIDTSTTTPLELRNKIARILGRPHNSDEFTVYINTFGFKYGLPQDAELVFDMRFMTNPFYDERLRPYTGLDQPVKDFIFGIEESRKFFEQWSKLVAMMLPLYQAQGKTRLSIAVGCTGGKHRSVCMGEALAKYLKEANPTHNIVISHREMLRWDRPADLPPTLCGTAEGAGAESECFKSSEMGEASTHV